MILRLDNVETIVQSENYKRRVRQSAYSRPWSIPKQYGVMVKRELASVITSHGVLDGEVVPYRSPGPRAVLWGPFDPPHVLHRSRAQWHSRMLCHKTYWPAAWDQRDGQCLSATPAGCGWGCETECHLEWIADRYRRRVDDVASGAWRNNKSAIEPQ